MKKFGPVLLAIILCFLTGCTGSNVPGETEPDTETAEAAEEETEDGEDEAEDEDEDEAEEDEAAPSDSLAADLAGTYELVREMDYSGESGLHLDEMDSYFNLASDNNAEGIVRIYEDGGELFADFDDRIFETAYRGYRLPVEIVTEPLYELCENQDWSANLINPRTKEKVFSFTLGDDGRLIRYRERHYETDEDDWVNITVSDYFAEGTVDPEDPGDIRFTDTVTVGDAKELLRAIKSSRKIILKEGVYDLSGAKRIRIDNVRMSTDAEYCVCDFRISGVSNLLLEAEEGADVEICIDAAYSPVLGFEYCDHIFLNGITFGHHVEPGTCSGSVLWVDGCNSFNVNDCHLYGCGTYGIEGTSMDELCVKNTEIYDCTYGIVSLNNSYNSTFENCSMHDNKDLTLIDLGDCHYVSFTDCEFTDNAVDTKYDTKFTRARDCSEVCFVNCTFEGNTYKQFSEGDDILIEKCTFRDQIVQ